MKVNLSRNVLAQQTMVRSFVSKYQMFKSIIVYYEMVNRIIDHYIFLSILDNTFLNIFVDLLIFQYLSISFFQWRNHGQRKQPSTHSLYPIRYLILAQVRHRHQHQHHFQANSNMMRFQRSRLIWETKVRSKSENIFYINY